MMEYDYIFMDLLILGWPPGRPPISRAVFLIITTYAAPHGVIT